MQREDDVQVGQVYVHGAGHKVLVTFVEHRTILGTIIHESRRVKLWKSGEVGQWATDVFLMMYTLDNVSKAQHELDIILKGDE